MPARKLMESLHEFIGSQGHPEAWKFFSDKPENETAFRELFQDYPAESFAWLHAFFHFQGDDRSRFFGFGDFLLKYAFSPAISLWGQMNSSQQAIIERINNIVTNLTLSQGLDPNDITVPLYSQFPRASLNRKGLEGKSQECLWKAYQHKFLTDCQRKNSSEGVCCELQQTLQNNVELVLKVMKYELVPKARIVQEYAERRDMEAALSNLPYNQTSDGLISTNPAVVACKFSPLRQATYNCTIFSRGYTDHGIGYVFNSAPFYDVFKNTTTNNAFYNEIVRKPNEDISGVPRSVGTVDGFNELEFFLDVQNFKNPKMALHNPWELGDLSTGLEIEQGYTYTISVKISKVEAQQGVLSMPLEKRNCMKSSENEDLSIFSIYR